METIDGERLDLFLRNNSAQLEQYRRSRKWKLRSLLSPRLRRLYSEYVKADTPEKQNDACAEVLNAYEGLFTRKAKEKIDCATEDLIVFFDQFGHRQVIDRSRGRSGGGSSGAGHSGGSSGAGRFRGILARTPQDYYSVAVIVKNEAAYIKEFVLFYQATGADRIYIYDNDSEDGLLEEIRPFIEDGLVVYRRWPGQGRGRGVQAAAYRDVIRRTKHRTKWLALIDADEFLFSPKGKMPDLLREYEQYPGVGANWVMYGPNGHDRRPEGLVMDNYTTTIADRDSMINCHIKSIVQPGKVSYTNHSHYAIYKGGKFAVNEDGEPIDNHCSFLRKTGRAFTASNHRNVFRINHYRTKSIEELEEKCRRGYPDGSPNALMEDLLKPFDVPVTEDLSIKPYADIVREKLGSPDQPDANGEVL